MKKSDKFKILCIDGGGCKGLYTATLLAQFEEYFNVRITDCFDMICGTSTGGIIALAASLGIPMSEVADFYKEYGGKIFAQKTKEIIGGEQFLTFKQTLMGAKYDGKELEKALNHVFGTRKISESKNNLCITSYEISTGNTKIFTEKDEHTCVDIALATSAAPTYFPIKHIENNYYIDGGVWANNPILAAFTEYLDRFYNPKKSKGVDILSVSSYEIVKRESPENLERSFKDWSKTLFDAYSHGQSDSALKLLDKLKGQFKLDYYRLKPDENYGDISMDEASKTTKDKLEVLAEETAKSEFSKEKINSFFETSKSSSPLGLWQRINNKIMH